MQTNWLVFWRYSKPKKGRAYWFPHLHVGTGFLKISCQDQISGQQPHHAEIDDSNKDVEAANLISVGRRDRE